MNDNTPNIDEEEIDEVIDEEVDEETDDVIIDEDDDEGFDFDENGDYIEEDDDEEESVLDADDVDTETPADEEDDRDATIAGIRSRLSELESLASEALKKLGVEETDISKGLRTLAAESDNLTLEEYDRKKKEDDRRKAADELLARTEFERIFAEDIAAIHAAYPKTAEYASVRDLPNVEKFARFRDLGLTAKQAFDAANPELVAQYGAMSARGLAGTKSNKKSVVPQRTATKDIHISQSEMATLRECFPGKTDKEIIKLYRETM